MLDTVQRDKMSIYQPDQAGLVFPEIPQFASHAEDASTASATSSPRCAPSPCMASTTGLPGT